MAAAGSEGNHKIAATESKATDTKSPSARKRECNLKNTETDKCETIKSTLSWQLPLNQNYFNLLSQSEGLLSKNSMWTHLLFKNTWLQKKVCVGALVPIGTTPRTPI